MNGRKNSLVILGVIVSVSLISSAVSVMLASCHFSRLRFDLLNGICGEMAEQEPEAKKIIAAALKEYMDGNADKTAEADILSELGYRISDFSGAVHAIGFAAAGCLSGMFLFLLTFWRRNRAESERIQVLADYLEQVNTGKGVILSGSGEDEFSKLEDEIYKTVTYLYQTKDAAVRAKNDFAENLFNIAHQIKTPITALSLSLQMIKRESDRSKSRISVAQVEKQLLRLTHLEEALLVLSRLDAGTLPLRKNEVDVFTLLVLAADTLQELFAGSGTFVDIPELGEMMIAADLDWTMEAVMNLMKNCMEHGGGGCVHCSYGRNPLYTEILIWDEGEGFAEEDMRHLFERFYRGKHAKEGGIGIGLALAKEIIERQNGTIRAKNQPGGGACFEIRFYGHSEIMYQVTGET